MTIEWNSPTPNYSLLALLLYAVIAYIPHAYSVALITSHNNYQWDNTSPRSTKNRTHVSGSVPQHIYRRFERSRAAHDNMLENMGLVVGGILAGVVCKLDAQWMNTMCAILLLARLAYIVSYVSISSQALSPMRTVWFLVAKGPVLMMYWKAGWKLVEMGQIP
jgi:uncharacterized MAPEG superfamily protein